MKRVVIFSLAYFPRFVGGAEVAVREITDRIEKEDIEFHLITLRFDAALPRYERVGRVHVHRIGYATKDPTTLDLQSFMHRLNKACYQVVACGKALILHHQHHFDAAWAVMAHSAGIPTMLFSFFSRVPYLLTLQEGDPPEKIERQMRFIAPFFRRVFTRASVVQAISHFLGDWARRMGFEGPLEIIPNGVDLEHFAKTYRASDIAIQKEKLGIKRGETLLITTSRLVHKNAVDDVIRALVYLPESVAFAVLGIGQDEGALRELARELGVEKRVRFIGHVNHADMPKYLQCADIFVRPSRSEGMGNSFIEAFASGLPVIATREGGIADFLFDPDRNPDHAPTGLAVDADSPAQIAGAVERLLGDKTLAKTLIKNGRALALRGYDWGTVAERMRKEAFARVL